MGKKLRTRLDLLHPDCSIQVQAEQGLQKQQSDRHRVDHTFQSGRQHVFVWNYGTRPRWMAGVIVQVHGSVTYMVRVNGQLWRQHADQICSRKNTPVCITVEPQQSDLSTSEELWAPDPPVADNQDPATASTATSSSMSESDSVVSPSSAPRYPLRNRRPPEIYT